MTHNRLPGRWPELALLLNRLGVGRYARSDWPAALCVVATVVNLVQMECAYGSMFAATARRQIRERARKLCTQYSGTMTLSGEHMMFVFDALPDTQDAHCGGLAVRPSLLLDRILTALADCPVLSGSAVAFPVIEAYVVHFDDEPFDIDSINSVWLPDATTSIAWREQFLADTHVAGCLFSAMDDGQIDFAFERVCDAKEPWKTQYLEALLCRTDRASDERSRIGSEVRSLERLGVVRRLDRWIAQSTIRRLRANPDARIGCNISAQSAAIDAWWAFLIATLADEPDVAARLTIEITETSPLPSLDAACEFVLVFKLLGCQVALDDVGYDFDSLRNLITLGVDIVKIDGALVVERRYDEAVAARFTQLIGLAKVCAASIVVGGIETADDAQAACASGATSLQGYLYSPSAGGLEN